MVYPDFCPRRGLCHPPEGLFLRNFFAKVFHVRYDL